MDLGSLLGFAVHWLGMLLIGDSWTSALELAAVFAISELLLLRFAPDYWKLPFPTWWPEELRPQQASPAERLELSSTAPLESDGEQESTSADEQACLSATFHGLSEEGVRFVHGWQCFELAAGQKSASLTFGFFPPFLTPPDCELDHEGECNDLSIDLEQITPAGARVSIKRRQASEAVTGKVMWHCS